MESQHGTNKSLGSTFGFWMGLTTWSVYIGLLVGAKLQLLSGDLGDAFLIFLFFVACWVGCIFGFFLSVYSWWRQTKAKQKPGPLTVIGCVLCGFVFFGPLAAICFVDLPLDVSAPICICWLIVLLIVGLYLIYENLFRPRVKKPSE